MINESTVDKLSRIRQMLNQYKNDSLTPDEVMKLLGVKRKRVEVLREKGVLQAFPLDPTAQRKDWRFKKVDLEVYLLNNTK